MRWLRPFPLLLGSYLFLALAYGVVTPLFEAPDEHHHFFTALFIADNGRLPQVTDPVDAFTRQEAAQPPLYYALAALLVRPFDTAGAREALWPNPFVRLGEPAARQNINAFVHSPAEAWPWRGYAAAAHALRAATALLGAGTLIALHATAQLLWPGGSQRALTAVALVAFLPQFAFVNATISNDAAITFLAALALWQWARLAGKDRPSTGALLLLGLTVGLAALTKNQGILLWPASAAVVGALAWRRDERPLAGALRAVALLSLVVVTVAGWLWWRNWGLYGDPTATNQFVALAGGPQGFSAREVAGRLPRVWRSLFAMFGWFNVPPPAWVDWTWHAVVLLAVAGGLNWLRRARLRPSPTWLTAPALWLALWAGLVVAAHLAFMRQTPADQGRLLFPALVPAALAVAAGISQLPSRRVLMASAAAGACLTSLVGVADVIPAAYERPPVVAQQPAEDSPQRNWPPLDLQHWSVADESVAPGSWVTATLFWYAPFQLAEPPVVVAELFGRDGALVGKQESYNGGGLFPASLWPPGAIVADRLAIHIADDVDAPLLAPLFVRIAGETASEHLGAVKIVPTRWPARAEQPLARLEGVALEAVALTPAFVLPGETAVVTLRWAVEMQPGRDLTTFVHLGDPAQPPLLQADGPPRGGSYPASVWAAGDIFDDRFELPIPIDFPTGRYPVHIGLYDTATGARLPLVREGERLPHDAWPLGQLDVRR